MNRAIQSGPKVHFRTFEDLEVYQSAREFRKSMYATARRLPDFEKYELASQMRRAAVSLTNNLAEAPSPAFFTIHLASQGSPTKTTRFNASTF